MQTGIGELNSERTDGCVRRQLLQPRPCGSGRLSSPRFGLGMHGRTRTPVAQLM
jgi:hypothetical protein